MQILSITILKQHYQYELVSSEVYRTSIISTIKYDNKEESLFFIPVHDMLEDLEIKNSQGKHLTVLSYREVREMFGIDIDAAISKRGQNTSNTTLEFVPVLLPASDSQYEKIFFTFTASIKMNRYEKTKFSPDININFRFKVIPNEFIIATDKYEISQIPFDVHILFKSGDDYRINDATKINVYPQKDINITDAKQNTFGTKGYFINDVGFDDVIIGSIDVGLTHSLLNTAKIVSAVTCIIPAILISIPFVFGKLFEPTLEILGLTVALLIGERFWILKDKFIMKRWLKIQRILLAFNGVVFIAWILTWGTDIWSVLPSR